MGGVGKTQGDDDSLYKDDREGKEEGQQALERFPSQNKRESKI
jgi:hypothetical protein